MIEYIVGMENEFGIRLPESQELNIALEFVRGQLRCDTKKFAKFIIWYFSCYAIEPPDNPFRVGDAWADYCEAGECIPAVVRADRVEKKVLDTGRD